METDKEIYYKKILNINNVEELEKVNNDCINCNNDLYLLTQDVYDKKLDKYIPLYYDELWFCFSFEEIFDIIYDQIKINNLIHIPDPLNMLQNISEYNEKIVLLFDKKFFNNKLKKLLESNRKKINLNTYLTTESKRELSQIKNDIQTKDIEISFFNFMIWYNNLSDYTLKSFIDNFLVSIDGKQIKFKILIDKYQNNPRGDCIKDFKIALLSLLNTIEIKKSNIEMIIEEEDDSYE